MTRKSDYAFWTFVMLACLAGATTVQTDVSVIAPEGVVIRSTHFDHEFAYLAQVEKVGRIAPELVVEKEVV